jgi:hypothetical protein
MAEFVINSKTHSVHERTPFELDHGYTPRFNIPVGRETGILSVDDRLQRLQEARQDAEAALKMEKRIRKENYESDKNSPHSFQAGDYVWLDSSDIRSRTRSRKLVDLQLGPFKIIEKVGELDYRLDLPKRLAKLHSVFHIDKLTPWKGNEVNGKLPTAPPPIELEGEQEYEVDEILDSRIGKDSEGHKELQYLIRWKGYDEDEDGWEPVEFLENAKKLITKFHKAHPAAPRRINATWTNLIWSIVEDEP